MKRIISAIVIVIFALAFWFGASYYIEYKTKIAGKYVFESFTNVSKNWSWDDAKRYFRYVQERDNEVYNKNFQAYSKLGRFIDCPQQEQNTIQIDMLDINKISLKITCRFQYSEAELELSIISIDGKLYYDKFILSSLIFTTP